MRSLTALLSAILADDRMRVKSLLKADAGLANCPVREAKLCRTDGVYQWLYPGDTSLHLAAAGYRTEIIRLLTAAGADPNSAKSRRHSAPLHHAAAGYVVDPRWDDKNQVKTIHALLAAGSNVNAQNQEGATALHRAVRTRCAAAVRCLLEAGADPTLANKSGSMPFHLAVQDTGRGGSGAPEAREAQRRIIKEFLSFGVSPALKDGKGRSVFACARSDWLRAALC